MFKHAVALGMGLGLVGLGTTVVRADEYQDLATSLAKLRGDVEQTSSKLAEEKSDLRDELRSYARQKSELALTIDRERIRLQKIRILIAQRQKEVDTQKAKSEALLPVFEHVAKVTRGYITDSLPFRTQERLAEVQTVEEQLRAGLLTPQKAVARIWTVLEDEFRLSRESGVYRQTITLAGEDQLADVVRVGMVTLYFKTSDGTVGFAARGESGWSFEPLSDPEDRKRVEHIFDSFKKQIRVGYFDLPGTETLTVNK